jgi:hypothetical protein
MGVVVSKRRYKSIIPDTSDDYSSIYMPGYYDKNGMSMVSKKSVHGEHFRRVLTSASTRGVALTRNAEQVSAPARRAPQRYSDFPEEERGQEKCTP